MRFLFYCTTLKRNARSLTPCSQQIVVFKIERRVILLALTLHTLLLDAGSIARALLFHRVAATTTTATAAGPTAARKPISAVFVTKFVVTVIVYTAIVMGCCSPLVERFLKPCSRRTHRTRCTRCPDRPLTEASCTIRSPSNPASVHLVTSLPLSPATNTNTTNTTNTTSTSTTRTTRTVVDRRLLLNLL